MKLAATQPLVALGLVLLTASCSNVTSLGGGGSVTELYVQNDTDQVLLVHFETQEDAQPVDGMVEAAPGERAYLTEDVAKAPLLPSQIVATLRVTDADGSTTLYEAEVDDSLWEADEDNSQVYSEYVFTVSPG